MRSEQPVGATAMFVAAVRAQRGDDYVRSWLSDTCQFEDRKVWTSHAGVERLRRECEPLLARYEVSVDADAESIEHYQAATEAALALANSERAALAAKKQERRLKRAGKA